MAILYGNAVVGQSGGPTSAINATLAGVIEGALLAKEQGIIGKLYGMRNGVEGLLEERLVDLTESTIKDNSRLFDSIDEVPRQALSMGIKNIMQAKSILMVS